MSTRTVIATGVARAIRRRVAWLTETLAESPEPQIESESATGVS